MMNINLNCRDAFHIHTFRCGHAECVPDSSYVEMAVMLGATSIWFADHAPFPGDPFGSRMSMETLEEYIGTVGDLREQFRGIIDVYCGLETEYLPSFDQNGYYQMLKDRSGLDFLLLGQHMAEISDGSYTFQWKSKTKNADEHKALCEAMLSGINSGYFDAVAHPDRIFRRCKDWTDEMTSMSKEIIDAARKKGIPIEKNLSSMEKKLHYRDEFWKLTEGDDVNVIYGLDAHTTSDFRKRYERQLQYD